MYPPYPSVRERSLELALGTFCPMTLANQRAGYPQVGVQNTGARGPKDTRFKGDRSAFVSIFSSICVPKLPRRSLKGDKL